MLLKEKKSLFLTWSPETGSNRVQKKHAKKRAKSTNPARAVPIQAEVWKIITN